jgi:hypothetical protein
MATERAEEDSGNQNSEQIPDGGGGGGGGSDSEAESSQSSLGIRALEVAFYVTEVCKSLPCLMG